MGNLSGPKIEANFFKANRRRLRELFGGTAPIVIGSNGMLQRSGDVAFPFHQDSNFWYLTGLNYPGLIMVLDGEKEYLIVPDRDPKHAVFDGAIDLDLIRNRSGIDGILTFNEGWKNLTRRLKRVKHVASLEPQTPLVRSISFFTNPARADLVEQIKAANPEIAILDLKKHFVRMRQIKQPIEIEALEYAVHHTDELFKLIKRRLSSYQNERDIYADAMHYAAKHGFGMGYDPVIAAGNNSLVLHYIDNNSDLVDDQPVLLDIGLRYEGYTADISRTYCVNPTKRQKQVYAAVCDVHEYALSQLVPGVSLSKYEKDVEHFAGEKLRGLGLITTISKEDVRRFYPHSTSHFLGIDVHDVGDYSQALEPGMVLTVEPGIYIAEEGFGVRLEDDVVITENGNRVLSAKLLKTIN